jgi:hypothetical protein
MPAPGFVPTSRFEVGRVKAVLGLEIDLMYGQGGPNDGGFPGNNTGTAGGVLTSQAATLPTRTAAARTMRTAVSTSTPTSAA